MHSGQKRQPRLPEVSRTGRQPLSGIRRGGDPAESRNSRPSSLRL